MTQSMARRAVLKAMGGAAWLIATGRSASAEDTANAAGDLQPFWTFDGVTGPDHWSELSPDYAACQFGIEQSPVNLVDALKVNGTRALTIDYRPVTAIVMRNRWTFQIYFEPGCEIQVNGVHYPLQQAVFRRPSEHLLSGRALEMELQLMHRTEAGAQAVLAVFIRQGRTNELLEMILGNVPPDEAEKGPVFPIDPADLLPPPPAETGQRAFYRYMGSLTTPPCIEGVNWTVFKTPIEASPSQIRQLAGLFPANARPASPINRRYLLEYGG